MYCVLFKAAVVTLWTFVEYFIAIPATPVSLQCSSGFSAQSAGGTAAPTAPPLATPLAAAVILKILKIDQTSYLRCWWTDLDKVWSASRFDLLKTATSVEVRSGSDS